MGASEQVIAHRALPGRARLPNAVTETFLLKTDLAKSEAGYQH